MEVFGKDKKQLDGVKRLVREGSIEYPVLYDGENRNYKSLGLKGMPAAFLLDATGTVVWEGYLTGKG